MRHRPNILASRLRPAKAYRREQLRSFSHSVDRDLKRLVSAGVLKKFAPGLYYHPKQTPFGEAPPEDTELVRAFLKDRDFLITSPNLYNTIGIGTTQLYNTLVVYNRKRHGRISLSGRTFDFRLKHLFPRILSEEFLLVDLMNNLDSLAEDRDKVREQVGRKALALNTGRLLKLAYKYGKVSTRRFFQQLIKS